MTTQTVKDFVQDSYQLVSASSPTVPLHGNDMSQGVRILNRLITSYSASGLLITISKQIEVNIVNGQSIVTFGDPSYSPTPDVTEGRLANLADAWLDLQGVTYPLIIQNRDVFYGSYKYDPQLGLPRFAIVRNDTNLTTLRLYPGASQGYTLNIFGKFQLQPLIQSGTMATLPDYSLRYLQFALAKDLAWYKGRSNAWSAKLEAEYVAAKQDIESVSTVNLTIETSNESYLNGSWRVMAGI